MNEQRKRTEVGSIKLYSTYCSQLPRCRTRRCLVVISPAVGRRFGDIRDRVGKLTESPVVSGWGQRRAALWLTRIAGAGRLAPETFRTLLQGRDQPLKESGLWTVRPQNESSLFILRHFECGICHTHQIPGRRLAGDLRSETSARTLWREAQGSLIT